MALDLNKTFVAGRLTRDVDLKALPSGQNVASFSIATNRTWTDKDGNRQEDVEFHNIVVFGKTAENCAKYLSKGRQAYVEGKIRNRSYEKDGETKYITEIVASDVQFLSGDRSQQSSQGGGGGPAYEPEPAQDEIPF